MNRAVFLDRDGVLVRTVFRGDRPVAPLRIEEFAIDPAATPEVERLRDAGFLRIVVTNQPEIARGLLTESLLDQMHRSLTVQMPLDDILVCPHESDSCACHKPAPGLLQEAARRWDIDLGASFLVGDRWRDIGAGQAAGCYSILLARPYSQCDSADASVSTLPEAVDIILRRHADASLRGTTA